MPEPDPLPSIKTPWGAATPPAGVAPGEVPPIPIPDHTLIRRVGKGSYGEVWLARNVLGVYRAVKIIQRSSFDDDRPFEREFAGMQRFEPVSRSHESQLNILQVGRGPDCFYYVMELADDMGRGAAIDEASYAPRNLRSELLLHGRLPVDECVRLGLALTTALENLHRHGLVHRDIKPSNIVFVNGIPKLADIGLVALAESAMSFVGTEGYLPPEGPGTVQADLFSLGKVLYEISTGRDRQQFPELPTGISELPDRAALAEFNEVILRACAPDVKQRYESAAEMHADLALLQSGKSVARMRAVERRLKFVARAGAVVTGIALLVGAAFLYQKVQTREARRLASENQALAEAKTRLAAEKSSLAEENREQLVRLRIANGVRLMDANDYSGALLWFADALPLVTNNPAEEAIQRIRIQQVLNQSPRLLHALAHDTDVSSGAFSPDGRRVATGTGKGDLLVWDAQSGAPLSGPLLHLGKGILDLRFTKDGTRLLARSCSDQARASLQPETDGVAAVVDAVTGQGVFPIVTNAGRTAFSPDDRWLAVARTNFVIEVLEASTGRHLLDLSGHTKEITMLSFSRAGSLIASASLDQTVRLWRLPSGAPVGPPIRHNQAVVRVVFSPDGRRLATATEATPGGRSCSIHTWDVASGTETGSAIQADLIVFALAFDESSGRRLFTADANNWVNVWDAETHVALFAPLRMENSTVRCWAFSPDGLRFATGSDDGTACVWNLETGEPLTPRLRHVGWVESVAFSPDGARLLTTSDDGTAKIWDLAVLPEAAKPLRLDGRITFLDPATFPHSLSPDGRHLVLSLEDFTLRLINPETLAQEGTPIPTPDGDLAGTVRFDGSSHQWAAALGPFRGLGRSQTVGLWRLEPDRIVHFDLSHGAGVSGVTFDPSGGTLFTTSGNKVWEWNTSDGSLRREVPLPEQAHLHLEYGTGTGGTVVIAHLEDVAFRLFNLASSQWAGPRLGANKVNQLQFSPDKTRLATVGSDQCGRIWDARTGQPLTLPFKHGGKLLSVEWSPNGRRVVTSGLSGEAKLWDADTGEPVLAPMGLEGTTRVGHIRVAHFSPDGRFLVARSDNLTARVWDAATAEAITPILAHAAEVRAAMVTTNNRLVTVSDPNLVRAWDLKETGLSAAVFAEYARLLAGRKLDRAGVLQPMRAKELGELCRVLRSNQPALFVTATSQLGEWHRRQVQELTTMAQVQGAAFHLAQIAALNPTNSEIKQLRAKVEARLIPARDPVTPASLVDLSAFYTHSFGLLPDGEFSELPRGRHTLAGTPFDLRGLVHLEAVNYVERDRADGRMTLASFPLPEVGNILVGRRCRQLHFLQVVDGPRVQAGDEVARWRIHFVDGSVREFPVIYGEHVSDWWKDSDANQETRKAVVARAGKRPTLDANQVIRLFKSTWENPSPDTEVSHLDFVIGKVSVRPFVVAITAE